MFLYQLKDRKIVVRQGRLLNHPQERSFHNKLPQSGPIHLPKKSSESKTKVEDMYGSYEYKNDANNLRQRPISRSSHLIMHNSAEENFSPQNQFTNTFFDNWKYSSQVFCNGRISAYANNFVLMHKVLLDKNLFQGLEGGKDVLQVLKYDESLEIYQPKKGALKISKCSEKLKYMFLKDYDINMVYSNLFDSIDTRTTIHSVNFDDVRKSFYLLVVRVEYANLYHQMTDFYNAFIIMKYFRKTKDKVNILLLDGHPKGSLDSVWSVLFNSSSRLSQLKPKTFFYELVWNIYGHSSYLLNHFLPDLPFVEEFRNFFLESYGWNSTLNSSKLNCSKIRIMFLWRKDYLAHPRNPSGRISRQISNTREILRETREYFPNFSIRGMQLDKYSMRHQLFHIINTDILIGMHGAGLTHALFLPAHAGLIELLPYYNSPRGNHFMAIARWRSLIYRIWYNNDPMRDHHDKYTDVPPGDILKLIQEVLSLMECEPWGRLDHVGLQQSNISTMYY